MALFNDAYSSFIRPAIVGRRGALATAHPMATAAGQEMLIRGGNAADALIAAQAVLTVISPDACGLGGDMLALISDPAGKIVAVNGCGASPLHMTEASSDGANSITVPGIVDAWQIISQDIGKLTLLECLMPAIKLATDGFIVSPHLLEARTAQHARLIAGGAANWSLMGAAPGDRFVQPELAELLGRIGNHGASAFYQGDAATAIEQAIRKGGGVLDCADLSAHFTEITHPVTASFGEWTVNVQPPPTQGVLLAMALRGRDRFDAVAHTESDHLCIELTEAAFAYRSRSGEGDRLLDVDLDVDLKRASRRGGPRAYLHTAGVSVADASGMVISSLVSVFDDFGSAVFVPELGITLNNRAGGFTTGPNAAGPGKKPIHTLAPAIVSGPSGVVGLATPGADGQIQTLLQVLDRVVNRSMPLDAAIAAPRWRSEGGKLLLETGHPAQEQLARLGHQVELLPSGDMRFGAVVAAGHHAGSPFAIADWRRECWSGVA